MARNNFILASEQVLAGFEDHIATNADLFFLHEATSGLASCLFRFDALKRSIVRAEPHFRQLAKITAKFKQTFEALVGTEEPEILFELESLICSAAGAAERLRRILAVDYKFNNGTTRIDLAIEELPVGCDAKEILSALSSDLAYLTDLRNFCLHRLGIPGCLRVGLQMGRLLIQLPDHALISKPRTKISSEMDLLFVEGRTMESEIPKWMNAVEKATRAICGQYFLLRFNERWGPAVSGPDDNYSRT